MGCCDETNIDGLTGNNVTLNTPTLNGGSMSGTKYAKDCNGADVMAGTAIATCANLAATEAALNAALAAAVANLNDTINDLPDDVRVTGAAWSPDFKLVLTLSNGQTVETAPLALAQQETASLQPSAAAEPDALTTDCATPTSIMGGRDYLLGRPVTWINVGGYIVPAFGEVCGGGN